MGAGGFSWCGLLVGGVVGAGGVVGVMVVVRVVWVWVLERVFAPLAAPLARVV